LSFALQLIENVKFHYPIPKNNSRSSRGTRQVLAPCVRSRKGSNRYLLVAELSRSKVGMVKGWAFGCPKEIRELRPTRAGEISGCQVPTMFAGMWSYNSPKGNFWFQVYADLEIIEQKILKTVISVKIEKPVCVCSTTCTNPGTCACAVLFACMCFLNTALTNQKMRRFCHTNGLWARASKKNGYFWVFLAKSTHFPVFRGVFRFFELFVTKRFFRAVFFHSLTGSSIFEIWYYNPSVTPTWA